MKKLNLLFLMLAIFVLGGLRVYAEEDGKLIPIPLRTDGAEVGGFVNPANATAQDGYTNFTTNGNISVVFKMLDVDVTDCDYILFKFANNTPGGLKYAFWNHDNKTGDLPAGITEFKYEWSKDDDCRVANGIIPEITLLSMWAGGISCDLIGVYKHSTLSDSSGDEGGSVTPDPKPVVFVAPNIGDDYYAIDLKQEDQEGGVVTIATREDSESYVTYTTKSNISVINKTKNVNVEGCDKIVIKFAEPTPIQLNFAAWGTTDTWDIPAGVTEYTYEFAKDPKCAINNNIIPEVSILAWFGNEGHVVKVSGIYKHMSYATPAKDECEIIPLEQNDSGTKAVAQKGGDYMIYTTQGDICVITKSLDVDVTGCDKIIFDFAEPIPAGISYSVWAGTKSKDFPEGITSFEYVIDEDAESALNNGILPQVCLVTIFKNPGKVVKIKGIYKHIAQGPKAITAVHGEKMDKNDKEVEVTYKRNFAYSRKWQSLYVPFSIDMNKVQDDIVIAKFCEAVEVNGIVNVTVEKVARTEVIPAKTPLFIASAVVGDVEIPTGLSTIAAPEDATTVIGDVQVTGVLAKAVINIKDTYVMSGGKLCTVAEATHRLGMNHWYMKPNKANAMVRISTIGFDADEATAIASVIAESMNAKSYSINGVEVDPANAKGLIIKNGKKVIVK